MTEAEWLTLLMEYALLQRWRVTHFRPAWTARGWQTPIQGHRGFPDLVCVRPPRIEFIELKTRTGRLSPEQKQWIEDLEGCYPRNPFIGVRVWTPDDWDSARYVLR